MSGSEESIGIVAERPVINHNDIPDASAAGDGESRLACCEEEDHEVDSKASLLAPACCQLSSPCSQGSMPDLLERNQELQFQLFQAFKAHAAEVAELRKENKQLKTSLKQTQNRLQMVINAIERRAQMKTTSQQESERTKRTRNSENF